MDKTLYGLAVIHFYWEQQGKDIIDAYVPLACISLIKSHPDKVTNIDLRNMLVEDYGLSNITVGAVTTILNRMVKQGLLNKRMGEYHIQETLYEKETENPAPPIHEADFEELCNKIVSFANDTFNEHYTIDEAFEGLMEFLDVYAEDLMLKPEEFTQTQRKPGAKKLRYIISCFTCDVFKKDCSTFSMMVKVATGRSLMSLITFDKIESLTGHMRNVKIYIDAPIVYNLLSLNGDANYELVNELMGILQKQGVRFAVFRIHHNEILNTMQDAIYRLTTRKYDYRLSSRLLKTALRNHMTASHLNVKRNQIDQLYEKWEITIEDAPNLQTRCYDIDMPKLSEIITNLYSNNRNRPLEMHEKELVETDVDAIAYTYRERGATPVTNLKDCKALLVTNNLAIAYATKVLNNKEIHHEIPGCVTDVFLSTMMWTMFPEKNQQINEKLLMSECYSNMLLEDKLILRYYQRLDEMHHQNIITDDQLVLARSSNLAYKLLEDITYNDVEAFTDETPLEVIERIQSTISAEKNALQGKLDEEERNVQQISFNIASKTITVIWGVLLILLLLSKIVIPSGYVWTMIWLVLSSALAIWGLLCWRKIIPSYDMATQFLAKRIENYVMKFLRNK